MWRIYAHAGREGRVRIATPKFNPLAKGRKKGKRFTVLKTKKITQGTFCKPLLPAKKGPSKIRTHGELEGLKDVTSTRVNTDGGKKHAISLDFFEVDKREEIFNPRYSLARSPPKNDRRRSRLLSPTCIAEDRR